MTSIYAVLILTFLHATWIVVDATDESEKDISLSADTQSQLDTVNDVQELKTLVINATKQRKKVEKQLKTSLNYAMFECALSIMKIDLDDAYIGQGIQKIALKENERQLPMPEEDFWVSSRTEFGRKNAVEDLKTCFLKWNAFLTRKNPYVFTQLVLKKLAEYHGRELKKPDITNFTSSVARTTVFLRQEWRDFLDIVKRNHVEFLNKNERRTFVDLLGYKSTLERWPIRANDIVYLNIVRDALLRKNHVSMWTFKKDSADIVLPYVPAEMCPAFEL